MQSQSIILLISILFILSTICERLTNFVKLYVDSECPGLKKWLSTFFRIHGKINKRHLNENDEKIREFNILKVNIFFGFVTAFIMDADLILMLGNLQDAGSTIGWKHSFAEFFKDKDYYQITSSILLKIVGWFLTGCFISLGSKFWHDLLDVVLEIKDAKNLINQESSKKLMEGNFSALSTEEQLQVIKDAIKNKLPTWNSSYSGVTGVSAAFKTIKGEKQSTRSIQFQVKSKSASVDRPIPKKIFHAGYFIPTDVIKAGIAKAVSDDDGCNYPGDNSNPRLLGSSISREGRVRDAGTICLKAYKTPDPSNPNNKVYYLLSCFHVLFPEEMKNNFQSLSENNGIYYSDQSFSNPNIYSPGTYCLSGSNWSIAQVTDGVMNNQVDAALAKLIDPEVLDTKIYKYGEITAPYTPTQTDEHTTFNVKMIGCKSGELKGGILANCSTSKPIEYEGGIFTINDLIQIDGVSAQGGDSGAAVIDNRNRIIGMVVATVYEDNITYAIPIQPIIDKLGISIEFSN